MRSSSWGSSRPSRRAARSGPRSCACRAWCAAALGSSAWATGPSATRSPCGRTPSASGRASGSPRPAAAWRCSVLEGFSNASRIPELRKRLLFTAGALAVYRLGVAIPTPGIDGPALAQFFAAAQNSIVGLVNLFSGGALERFSIFALGIMPYISASIILQLLTVVIPYLEKLSKEGELGRRKITQYTRYFTVVLSLVQSFFIAVGLESVTSQGGGAVVYEPGWYFRLMAMMTL